MKKRSVLAFVLAMCFALTLMAPMTASAATAISIEDDFFSYTDGDLNANFMSRLFKVDSVSSARIKYAFGAGYCCPSGGGETGYLVYKVEGGTFSDLKITVKGHFSSREGYSADWTTAPSCKVEVSTDGGNTYTTATTWQGEFVDGTLGQNDYSTLTAKTYNADLTSAVSGAGTVYIRLAWDVYDYPLYSSIHSVKIEGSGNGDGAAVAPGTTTTTTTTTKLPTQTTTTTTTTKAPDATTTTAPDSSVDDTSSDVAPDDSSNVSDSSDVSDGSDAAGDVSGDVPDTDTSADPDASDATGGSQDEGAPVVLIVVIVMAVLLIAAVAVVFMLFKMGIIKVNK